LQADVSDDDDAGDEDDNGNFSEHRVPLMPVDGANSLFYQMLSWFPRRKTMWGKTMAGFDSIKLCWTAMTWSDKLNAFGRRMADGWVTRATLVMMIRLYYH
jgi:hypothetical protein